MSKIYDVTLYVFVVSSILLVVYEFIWSKRNRKKIYDPKAVACNLAITAFIILVPNLFVSKYLFTFFYEYRLFTIEESWLALLLVIPITDLGVYWSHRAEHKFGLLWASHMLHHSDVHLNFSVPWRIHWIHGIVQSHFLIPIILLGFPINYVLYAKVLNFFYQFWTHTESIGKLRFVEGWISTPSAHRVHHSCNDIYVGKNFATMFTLWDRVFGTYQPETEKCVFGTKEGFVGYNPIRLYVMPYVNWIQRRMNYRR